MTIHKGKISSLRAIKEDLLQYIMAKHLASETVCFKMVVTKASELDATFCQKDQTTKEIAVRHFIKSNKGCVMTLMNEMKMKKEANSV